MSKDLGLLEDFDALTQIVSIGGLRIADIGCGAGVMSKLMAQADANVVAVEPDSVQAAENRKTFANTSIEFHEAGAENLPLEDASIDGAIFNYSLHHVPGSLMINALEEAQRVLKSSGFLYIAEPVAEGNYHDVIAPFHDETQVRAKAQKAVTLAARTLFKKRNSFSYTTESRFNTFADFVDHMAPLSYNTGYSREDIETPEVEGLFSKNKIDSGYLLTQPIKIDLLKEPVKV